MRIDLNLAKEPFRNRSMFWLGMTAAFLVAFTALVLVAARAANVGADTAALREERARQEQTIKDLQTHIDEVTDVKAHAVFSDADRRALDDARELLNARSFSWSRLLNDLEPNVPENVKLTSIEIVGLTGEGADRVATLAIQGKGRNFAQLGEFIARLDATGGRFDADPGSIGQDDQSQDFRFTVVVRYRAGVALDAPSEGRGDA